MRIHMRRGMLRCGQLSKSLLLVVLVAGADCSVARQVALRPLQPPRNGTEFEQAWTRAAGDAELQLKLLQALQPAQLGTLLKDSLTGPVLRAVLRAALDSLAPRDMKAALGLLQALVAVPRFALAVLSLSVRCCPSRYRTGHEALCRRPSSAQRRPVTGSAHLHCLHQEGSGAGKCRHSGSECRGPGRRRPTERSWAACGWRPRRRRIAPRSMQRRWRSSGPSIGCDPAIERVERRRHS